MQATIYVTQEAFQTAQMIKDMDYYERANLCDELEELSTRPGYHLKNANKLKLAPLPADAHVALCLNHIETVQITMPANLRGCIFEGAPDLPEKYADIITYWSGETINASTSGAVYFQCQLNAYMVDLGPKPLCEPVINDRLLSEGVGVAITGLSGVLSTLSPEDFIEVRVPVDHDMLGVEQGDFLSGRAYGESADSWEQVFLKVADILASPDQDRIYIDLLCNELIDYGYWY